MLRVSAGRRKKRSQNDVIKGGGRVGVKLVPVYDRQAQFLNSVAKILGFVGGRGAGKTRVGSMYICQNSVDGDPWMCVSPDAGVVTETTLPTFLEVAKQLGCYLDHKLSPYPRVFFSTCDGGQAEIVFRSAEKPKKLHGPSKAGLWLDEASLQTETVFQDAIPTLRWHGKMGPTLMTFTPKGRQNWTFAAFYDPVAIEDVNKYRDEELEWIADRPYRRKTGRELIHARSDQNPFAPPEYVDVLSGTMSKQLAMQELGGSFIDISGLMFDRVNFEIVEMAPREAMRVRYWDKAATPGGGSYTAGALVARTQKGQVFVEDVVRGQWSYHERDTVIRQTAEADRAKYGGEVIIVAEQEGGSAGKQVMHEMIVSMGEFAVHRHIVGGKQSKVVDGIELPGEAKVVRALPLAGQVEAGNVKIVRGVWNMDFLDEIVAFPESSFADQVDACSGAYLKLTDRMFVNPGPASKQRLPAAPSGAGGALATLQRTRTRQLYGMERTRGR